MTEKNIEIQEIAKVDAELIAAMNRLIPQLSNSNPPPDRSALEEIVASDSSILIAAFIDGVIVGSLTLITFSIPTGKRAWIEDVVVDENYRNTGIGEALNQEAINIARRLGAKTVDLTSRPSREAANRLYSRLGFVQRKTNIYRFEI
ncbi:MAG: GNAT family N-acetyltransferase [Acidimicrobiales bacterium]|jgi:ribosomal protein S18 acetylase RimI-like enzyme|nr:GNAT family N-acetyltransferase [Acidimicrobiaceae bacterium]MDP6161478.1 GNAT family N-acetyltransferase [Acidimicrobiales bacterium]MDP6284974.1 GNAT family N-acetyltransferase [Acidimicrobiales bacterium]HJL92089.1 GNAT family N-acetyltransferase [Acidimicrobiales bacterium]HJO41532.1 GNAT family N-acetyltransferase [Acidimicrobiales bacterium]|tara:strand:- start:4010 stop:4450 length:441 start_codon:yes stop_codon:yes gene_type:complete